MSLPVYNQVSSFISPTNYPIHSLADRHLNQITSELPKRNQQKYNQQNSGCRIEPLSKPLMLHSVSFFFHNLFTPLYFRFGQSPARPVPLPSFYMRKLVENKLKNHRKGGKYQCETDNMAYWFYFILCKVSNSTALQRRTALFGCPG